VEDIAIVRPSVFVSSGGLAMGKIGKWFLEKLIDQLWGLITVAGVIAIFTSVYAALGLWRSIVVGVSAGLVSLGVIQIYRQENGLIRTGRKQLRKMERCIASLDEREKEIVASFAEYNSREFPDSDPAIVGLEAAGILVRLTRPRWTKGNLESAGRRTVVVALSDTAKKILAIGR
jgi:hypothetical protein